MKLRHGLGFAMVIGLGAGCSGTPVGGIGEVGGAAAELASAQRLHKRRDLQPPTTGPQRIERATRKATALTARDALLPPAVLPQAVGSAPQPSLTYRNGPMLQSVEIYAVYWGPNISSDLQATLPHYFAGLTEADSPMQKMLQEYNINGQTIGDGTFEGAITDADAPIPADHVITDEMIEAEGARLVDTGKVPAEDGKNILMFFFPAGVKIDQGGGTMSCEVFCAYHSTFLRNGNNFYYGVIPDQGSGGCEQGCGLTGNVLRTTYSTTSHELIEAITDAAVGLGDLAWYDDQFDEIGDICTAWDGLANGFNVQSEWSNAARGCTDHAPTTNAAIDVSYDGTAVTAPNASATFQITSSGNASGQLTLGTDLYTGAGGFGVKFTPTTIDVGNSATLTVTVPDGTRSQDAPFRVTATDSNGVHHFAQVALHIKGAAPTITAADPATGPSNGGTLVTLTGTNFGLGSQAYVCDSLPCSKTALSKPVQGEYIGGTNGQTFKLITPSHFAAKAGGTATHLVVINANDATQAAIPFTYTTGVSPKVTAVSPAKGPIAGGTFVTITGANFSSTSSLHIAGQKLVPGQTFAVLDDQTIIALTPMVAAAGKQDITVYNSDGRSGTLTGAFEYGPNVPPSVERLSVDRGPTAGGTYVTIYGADFDATPSVTFGGVAAAVKTVNGSFLGVVTPPHAAGAVDVVVSNGDGQTASSTYTYDDGNGGGDDMGGANGGGGDDMGGAGNGDTDDMGGANGNGGDDMGGGGTGGNGGTAGSPGHGTNAWNGQGGGCAVGGDASSAAGLLLVACALILAMRRRRI